MPGGLSSLRDPTALTVGALAVHRLTRLVVDDEVSAPLREWAQGAKEDTPVAWRERTRLGYLVACPWCVSMWAAAGWAALTVAAPRAAATAGAVLAWSSVAGLLSSWE